MSVLSYFAPGYDPAGLSSGRAGPGTYLDATGIIQTAAIDVPRNNHYHHGASGVNSRGVRGLLMEQQATNLVEQSTTLDNTLSPANWGGAGTVSITRNYGYAPDGTLTATRIVGTGAHNWHATETVVASTTYTFSWYARDLASAGLEYSVYDITHGANIVNETSYFSSVSRDFYRRMAVTFTTPAGCTSVNIYPTRPAGATNCDFLCWGVQLEVGSYATSFIFTTTAAVLRETDLMNFSLPYPPQELSWYWKGFDVGKGTDLAAAVGPVFFGNYPNSNLDFYPDGSGWNAQHGQSAATSLATISGAMAAYGQLELRHNLFNDGSVSGGRSFDGAAESSAGPGSPLVPQPDWGGSPIITFAGGYVHAAFIAMTGIRTMAELQAALTQAVVPVADVAAGTWTDEAAGIVDLWSHVDEVGAPNDADYIQSASSPVAATVKLALGSPGVPFTGPWTLSLRHRKG